MSRNFEKPCQNDLANSSRHQWMVSEGIWNIRSINLCVACQAQMMTPAIESNRIEGIIKLSIVLRIFGLSIPSGVKHERQDSEPWILSMLYTVQ